MKLAVNIGRNVGQGGNSGRGSTTEPIGRKCLVSEDGAKSIGIQLRHSTVGEELKDESDLRESGDDSSSVEFEFLVFLLILDSR
jgi:hypothetical protein